MGWLILPALCALSWLYATQPPRLRRFWGRALGYGLRALGIRSEVVRTNLMYAFPPESGPDAAAIRDRLFRESYSHLGQLILEILMLFGPMPRFARRSIRVVGGENFHEAARSGRGAIMLASHVGNWECMAAGGALNAAIPVMLVTKRLKPAWLHEAIEKGRAACSVAGTYEPRTMRDVLAQLKAKKAVGMVLDQFAGPPIGVRVPFFGIPVGTMTAVAAIAKRTGAAVLPSVNYRLPDGSFVLEIRAPVAWIAHEEPAQELALNTANYAAILERDIRAHPEQWLWTHRRFKGDLSPLREGEWNAGRARR